jgi:hypothetical protein
MVIAAGLGVINCVATTFNTGYLNDASHCVLRLVNETSLAFRSVFTTYE